MTKRKQRHAMMQIFKVFCIGSNNLKLTMVMCLFHLIFSFVALKYCKLTWKHCKPVDGPSCIPSCEPNMSPTSAEAEKRVLSGKVTSIFDDHGLIDHYIYFDIKDIQGFGSSHVPSIGDCVHVEAEQTRACGGWKAYFVSLVEEEKDWNDKNPDFRIPTVYEERGSMIGLVTSIDLNEMNGTIENDVTFNISDITQDYIPRLGDWVQAGVCKGSIATNVRPLRTKQMTGSVTHAPRRDRGDHSGSINEEVYFEESVCVDNYRTRRDDHVAVTAIESNQGKNTWRATKVQFIGRTNKNSEKTLSNRKTSRWVLRGERPQFENKRPKLPSFLPQYCIPQSLHKCVDMGGDILHLYTVLMESLCPSNYAARFSALLHLEEMATEKEIETYRLNNVAMSCRGEFLVLNVPGVSDGKPSLCIGDVVILRETGVVAAGPEHHGFIHHIIIGTEELLIKFHEQLHCSFEESDRFDASFTYSRTPFRRGHLAVNLAKQRFEKHILFPEDSTEVSKKKPQSKVVLTENGDSLALSSEVDQQFKFFNTLLNERQRHAVQRILQGEARPKPYILFGPPGTGKTVTLVEAILQIITHVSSSRMLVCAPSNSAVDLLCECLHNSGKVNPQIMVRFNAFRRPPQAVSEDTRRYCHPEEALSSTARYRVVLTTCVNAGPFFTLQLRSDHFTHVCVDEAGQASEPECLIPIALASQGQIVLTGDPEQLGSVLKSSYAMHYGLGISLLERLMYSKEYCRNIKLFGEGYNPLLVTKLINNYRSHPSIITLPSLMFYDDELKAYADKKLRNSLCEWNHLPKKKFPLIFHGIMGDELREENCPSWFNAAEVVQVTRYVKLLINSKQNACSPSDIGVITPYKKQVEKVRMMLRALHVEGIKVGSVEEFQGQERKVIVISTVRSRPACGINENDECIQSLLGFVSSPKRFNVAITRAQALMIVLGNPFVLIKDHHWKALLKYCVVNGGYTGCDISPLMGILY